MERKGEAGRSNSSGGYHGCYLTRRNRTDAKRVYGFGNVLKKLKGSDEERKNGERKGRKGNGNEDIDNKMSALRE